MGDGLGERRVDGNTAFENGVTVLVRMQGQRLREVVVAGNLLLTLEKADKRILYRVIGRVN